MKKKNKIKREIYSLLIKYEKKHIFTFKENTRNT